ncbi:MAG: hypothetical protein HDR88_10235 [Bacteroides sp.]|nr:hypothetical protein [Bacteroides sp.]
MKFNKEKFRVWENETHIPDDIMTMVNHIAEKIGHCGEVSEETITIYNRGGYAIGYAKGFSITHCTSSYADGPTPDLSRAFSKWLKGLDFKLENSFGDNGMDCATNWHDTFWTNQFIYKPSEIDEEAFIIWEDGDYEE